MTRRVVITGIGAVSSLGKTFPEIWSNVSKGVSGIKKISTFDASTLPAQIGGEVTYTFENDIEKTLLRKLDFFSIYGLYAAIKAAEDAGLLGNDSIDKERAGVLAGSGIGGVQEIYSNSLKSQERGFAKISPFFIPKSLINMLSGHISTHLGYKGHIGSVVAACATGAYAIAEAMHVIMRNEADVMICGGSEGAIHPLSLGGFCACGALSTKYNDTPERASRPWDQGRDGFVMSDGACLLVLEEYEHAKARGAKIYAEVVSAGITSDAYHMTAPPEDGNGAKRAMEKALVSAGVKPEQVGYINAHGTSTLIGDKAELTAIKDIFGTNSAKISSTKSTTGHLLGAAGSLEAAITAFSLVENFAPPTMNLENPDPVCEGMNIIKNAGESITTEYALSNSFGFGGVNVALLLKRV